MTVLRFFCGLAQPPSMLAALSGVLMLVADGAGGLELALQVLLHRLPGIALDTHDDLYPALIEDLHGAAAHAAGDDDLHAHIPQEVGQKARPVAGIGDALLGADLALRRVIDVEVLAVAEVAAHLSSHTGNSNFHVHTLLLLLKTKTSHTNTVC